MSFISCVKSLYFSSLSVSFHNYDDIIISSLPLKITKFNIKWSIYSSVFIFSVCGAGFVGSIRSSSQRIALSLTSHLHFQNLLLLENIWFNVVLGLVKNLFVKAYDNLFVVWSSLYHCHAVSMAIMSKFTDIYSRVQSYKLLQFKFFVMWMFGGGQEFIVV